MQLFDMRDDPWPRATDLINPVRRVSFHRDGEFTEPAPSAGPRVDSPVMVACLEAAARDGAELAASNFYGRRPAWLVGLETYSAGRG